MTGKTHAAAGAFVGAAAGQVVGAPIVGLLLGALAGLLPDIDHPGSILGRKVKPVSIAVNVMAGHRGITHTIWFCGAAAVGMALISAAVEPILEAVIPWPSPLAVGFIFFLGTLSHLLLDGMTISGVEPFYPVRLPGCLAWLQHPRGR